jgi:hypothetical protein
MSQQSQETQSLPTPPDWLGQFDRFAKTLVSTMQQVASVAQNGVSTFLLALGTAILIVAMFFKLRPVGIQLSDLTPIEFVALVIAAGSFVVFGACIRLYHYSKDREVANALTNSGTRLVESTLANIARLQEKAFDAGVRKTEPPPSPPVQL